MEKESNEAEVHVAVKVHPLETHWRKIGVEQREEKPFYENKGTGSAILEECKCGWCSKKSESVGKCADKKMVYSLPAAPSPSSYAMQEYKAMKRMKGKKTAPKEADSSKQSPSAQAVSPIRKASTEEGEVFTPIETDKRTQMMNSCSEAILYQTPANRTNQSSRGHQDGTERKRVTTRD
ncbi:hypothetical protein WR25_02460 [Diploscapter pachys]|uniref:Uncharacterized protein n=1 Tax=Diploscapter pachys TaxID=2018661 RepID=A0A2A2KKS4_9BILA|nr:hypothetical protein WR25_02460 [Diploscapter pachys]